MENNGDWRILEKDRDFEVQLILIGGLCPRWFRATGQLEKGTAQH